MSNQPKTSAPTTNPIEVREFFQQTTDVPTPQTAGEEHYLQHQVEVAIRKEYLVTLRNNNRERLNYARKTFILTCFWIGVVIIIVILNSARIVNLSDTVLITLISTTTINVFGFFYLVIKYLFHTPGMKEGSFLKEKE